MMQQIEISQPKIDCKVLFTGDAEHIIDSLKSYIPRTYDILKCAATEDELNYSLEKELPHVLVICLTDTPRNLVQTYSILQNSVRCLDLPVILIARDEDYINFKSKVFVKNLTHFTRPIDKEKFTRCVIDNVSYYIEKYARPFAEAQAKKSIEQAKKVVSTNEAEASSKKTLSNTRFSANDDDITRRIEKMQRKEILVVDDDVRMLNVIKLHLQDLYDVTVVPSGRLALKFLSKRKADLVLLDYLMPEMMGPEVLKEIRESTPHKSVPVVFLTGVSDKELIMRCLEYKPNGYLLKPISREALLERVTEILLDI